MQKVMSYYLNIEDRYFSQLRLTIVNPDGRGRDRQLSWAVGHIRVYNTSNEPIGRCRVRTTRNLHAG